MKSHLLTQSSVLSQHFLWTKTPHLDVRLELPARGGAIDEDRVVVAPLGRDANAVLRHDNLRLDSRVVAAERQLLYLRAVVVGESAAELLRVVSDLSGEHA